MNITDILAQTGGLQSIAKDVGVSENEAATGAAALLPAILGGIKKQAQPTGSEGLSGLLGKLGGGNLLDQVLSPQPTDVNPGNEVLGQIFGSKDVSRAVAQNAASQSGLEPSVLKKMLPILAMLVTGYLAKQGGGGATAGGGGLGGMLGSLLGGLGGGSASSGTAASGGLASMLDLNSDSNPLDDILKMVGKDRS